MKLNEDFVISVSEYEIDTVRLLLSNELMLDPRGKSFEAMLNYAESHLKDLFVDDDGISYEYSPDSWDKVFMFNLKNDLDANFSRSKLTLYADVAKKVLRSKAEELNATENTIRRKVSQREKKESFCDSSNVRKPYNQKEINIDELILDMEHNYSFRETKKNNSLKEKRRRILHHLISIIKILFE